MFVTCPLFESDGKHQRYLYLLFHSPPPPVSCTETKQTLYEITARLYTVLITVVRVCRLRLLLASVAVEISASHLLRTTCLVPFTIPCHTSCCHAPPPNTSCKIYHQPQHNIALNDIFFNQNLSTFSHSQTITHHSSPAFTTNLL